MSEAEPNIIFADRREITVTEPNGVRHTWRANRGADALRIKSEEIPGRQVRQALLDRGGLPESKQAWYLRRDAGPITVSWRVTIASAFETRGFPVYESHEHRHQPMRGTGLLAKACDGKNCDDEHCEHVVVCGNPHCQEFFAREWSTLVMLRKTRRPGDDPGIIDFLPLAAPNISQRPRTTTEHEQWLETSRDERSALAQARAMGQAIGETMRNVYQPTGNKQ